MKNVVSKSNFALYLLHRKIKNFLTKRSESDRELMNSRSDRNGIEGNQPHHSFLSLSRLSFLSLLELLGFFMLAIFIGMTLVFWNMILFFSFIKFMFSKKATNIWRNLQFMEIFLFLWLWWFTTKNDPPQTLILAHTVAIWTFTFHEKSGCV